MPDPIAKLAGVLLRGFPNQPTMPSGPPVTRVWLKSTAAAFVKCAFAEKKNYRVRKLFMLIMLSRTSLAANQREKMFG